MFVESLLHATLATSLQCLSSKNIFFAIYIVKKHHAYIIPTPETKYFHERQENEMLRLEVGALRSSLLHQRGNTQKVENQTICGAFNDHCNNSTLTIRGWPTRTTQSRGTSGSSTTSSCPSNVLLGRTWTMATM